MRMITVLVCLAPLTGLAAAGEAAAPRKAENPLLGCWQSTENPEKRIRFEAKRMVKIIKGRLDIIPVVRFEPGKVTLQVRNQELTLPYTIAQDTVTFQTGKEGGSSYKRLDRVPPELELKPLVFAAVKELSRDLIKSVQGELKQRVEKDQAVRKDPARHGEMSKVDTDNTAWLKQTVSRHGWIDVDRFGYEASHAAFLLVQHSGDIPLMMAALPEIEKDVKAGKFPDGQPYALLYDRLQLRLGGKQRYGTQIGSDGKGGMVVLPLENRAKVEEYRREIKMFPLSQYLQMFEKMSGRKVKFSNDPPAKEKQEEENQD